MRHDRSDPLRLKLSGPDDQGGAPTRQSFVRVLNAGPDPGPFLRAMVRGTTV